MCCCCFFLLFWSRQTPFEPFGFFCILHYRKRPRSAQSRFLRSMLQLMQSRNWTWWASYRTTRTSSSCSALRKTCVSHTHTHKTTTQTPHTTHHTHIHLHTHTHTHNRFLQNSIMLIDFWSVIATVHPRFRPHRPACPIDCFHYLSRDGCTMSVVAFTKEFSLCVSKQMIILFF